MRTDSHVNCSPSSPLSFITESSAALWVEDKDILLPEWSDIFKWGVPPPTFFSEFIFNVVVRIEEKGVEFFARTVGF